MLFLASTAMSLKSKIVAESAVFWCRIIFKSKKNPPSTQYPQSATVLPVISYEAGKMNVISINADPDALLTEKDAARLLGLSIRFLQKHRSYGDGPPFVRISSRCIRYRRSDLKEWSGSRIATSTAACNSPM